MLKKLLLLILCLCLSSCTISWIGKPVISDDDKWAPSYKWLPCIDMGLRSDGVMVWKNSEQDKCK